MTPELVDARPGEAARTRWSEQFDAALTNVFEVQAEIAGKVASALGVALADSVRDELASRPTGEPRGVRCLPPRGGRLAEHDRTGRAHRPPRHGVLPAGRGARFGVRARLGPALPGVRGVVLRRQSDRGRRPAGAAGGGAGPGARAESPRGVCRAVQLLPARVAGLPARARDLRGRASAGPQQRRSAQRSRPRRAVAGPLGSRAGAIPTRRDARSTLGQRDETCRVHAPDAAPLCRRGNRYGPCRRTGADRCDDFSPEGDGLGRPGGSGWCPRGLSAVRRRASTRPS